MSKKRHSVTGSKKRSYKRTNKILEDHSDWLLINISTSKHPGATMAIDAEVWKRREGGRVYACCSARKYIYAHHHVNGKHRYFHHQALPKKSGLEIDHIKHGTMTHIDNRRSNLRCVTMSQNQMNKGKPSNNTSGIQGVFWNKTAKKWHAQIYRDGQQKHLGVFADISDAIDARKAAELKYFGEFAFNGGE